MIPDMATDHIRYDILAQAALRGVVRTVLSDAAKKGLPGRYPEEMTIVLQHQFWDLIVTEPAFEVGLSFGGIPERIGIPFDAITAFFDPAVQFGFQFEIIETATEGDGGAKATENVAGPLTAKPESLPIPAAESTAAPDSSSSGEVVRLDRFRKK
jgi:hypothetical protein